MHWKHAAKTFVKLNYSCFSLIRQQVILLKYFMVVYFQLSFCIKCLKLISDPFAMAGNFWQSSH